MDFLRLYWNGFYLKIRLYDHFTSLTANSDLLAEMSWREVMTITNTF